MPDDKDKSEREVRVFYEFITRSGLSIDRCSVEKRHPGEPDILCRVSAEGFVAFELVEICDGSIASAVNWLLKQNDPDAKYIRPVDPVRNILIKKWEKKYETPHPIELLVYAGRTLIMPDQIISKINTIFCYPGNFRRIWFMGQPDETCECVIDHYLPVNE